MDQTPFDDDCDGTCTEASEAFARFAERRTELADIHRRQLLIDFRIAQWSADDAYWTHRESPGLAADLRASWAAYVEAGGTLAELYGVES